MRGHLKPAVRADDESVNVPGRRTTQHGFGKRDYSWEIATGIQRELRPGVSADATYFRRWYGNFLATDNRWWAPGISIRSVSRRQPTPRLPGGGGEQICGLYDITPAKFGLVNDFVTFADTFGKRTEVYNGVDLTLNARLPRRAFRAGRGEHRPQCDG